MVSFPNAEALLQFLCRRGEGFDVYKHLPPRNRRPFLEPAMAAGGEFVSYKRFFTESAAS